MARVELRGVRKSFAEVTALAGVSLDIASGEFFTLLGPSGCGKTTLLRTIAGFVQQDDGEVRLDGKAVSGTQKGSSFVAATLPKSVRPVYWWDGYNAALSDYTAYDRNRLLWRLGGGAAPRFLSDTIFVHNYRFFFAFVYVLLFLVGIKLVYDGIVG